MSFFFAASILYIVYTDCCDALFISENLLYVKVPESILVIFPLLVIFILPPTLLQSLAANIVAIIYL